MSLNAEKEINFLQAPDEILKALLLSKEKGTLIGIRSNVLGSQTIITAVEDIIFEEGQTYIILKYYDASGYILPSHKIDLQHIEAVIPFSTPFHNPILDNLSKNKSWSF
jgi:hypothetical protein